MASSSASYADIISRPPFYAIAGVNPSSPIPAQMEQIDQLNTLLLQEIDANFARLHALVTSRILPEIKRFALANQPTREAAMFWESFYVQAFGDAPGERSTELNSPERTQYEDHTATLSGSFFDPPPGTTSTPLRQRGREHDESFDDSLGSPFDRVDRQLSRLSLDTEDAPTPSIPSGYTVPGGRTPESSPEYDSTLRYQATTPRPGPSRTMSEEQVSPTLHRSPATRLIDLTSTPLGTDFRPLAPSAHTGRTLFGGPSSKPANSTQQPRAPRHLYDDDDDVKLGMSPPVTMKFSLPPQAQSIVNAGTTPIKSSRFASSSNKTARELDDLIDNMSDYEPSPRMPTPENLRRYSVAPGDLEAARRLFNEPVPGSSTEREPSPSPRTVYDDSEYPGHRTRRSLANTSFGSDIQYQRDVTGRIIGDDESIDNDDDDTMSNDDDTAGYAAQAAQGFEFVDNSYDSDASGYPAARDVTDTDVPHGSGETSLFGKAAPGVGQGFALHQQDEMVTYHGGRLEDAAGPDSPTRKR